MKILVLSKRQYMAKDLLDDRFGRFRESFHSSLRNSDIR